MKRRDLIVYIVGTVIAAALIVFSVMRMTKKPEPEVAAAAAPVPAATPAAESSAAAAQRISLADLQKSAHTYTLLDVRDAQSYLAGHIPGALHIPLAYVENEIPYLPKDKPIVTYCTCPAEESSGQAAAILNARGVPASALLGGYRAWVDAKLPVHEGREP